MCIWNTDRVLVRTSGDTGLSREGRFWRSIAHRTKEYEVRISPFFLNGPLRLAAHSSDLDNGHVRVLYFSVQWNGIFAKMNPFRLDEIVWLSRISS